MTSFIWNLYSYLLTNDQHAFDVLYIDKKSSGFVKFYVSTKSKLYKRYKQKQLENDPFYKEMRTRYWKNK